MKVTIEQMMVGSKSKKFLEKLKHGDDLFLYSKGHVWAKLCVDSEGFEDSIRIWSDDIYPYRFKVKVDCVLEQPICIETIGGSKLLRDTLGPQWGFKVLFTPNELPNDLVGLIVKNLKDKTSVKISEIDRFFEQNLLFGLKGKKLEIEKEKLKDNKS